MSLRTLLQPAAAVLIAGFAFAMVPTAPAFADEDVTPVARPHVRYHPVRPIVRTRTVVRYIEREAPQPPAYLPEPVPQVEYQAAPIVQPYYYQSGCGHCGTSYVAVQPAPVYSLGTGCGHCGTSYVAVQPQYYAVQPQYYAAPCGNCGSAYMAPRYSVQTQCGYVNGRGLC